MITWPTPEKESTFFPVAQPDISENDIRRVSQDLLAGNVSGASPTILEAEKTLGTIVSGETLLVSNGSVAIMLALRALDIGAGDEVIVPNLTYAATASSVINVGATPVFCDSDEKDWNVSADAVVSALTPKTRAIILVDLYGVTRDWSSIVQWAKSQGVFVIHDCAESLTSSWMGTPTGVSADIRTYSFFANKLITCGEGGAVATSNPDLLKKMRILRGQGMSETMRYWFDVPGYNFRISSPQASLLLSQLQRISTISMKREELFNRYDQLLDDLAWRPKAPEGVHYSPWMYTVALDHIEPLVLATALARFGVETRPVFYPLTSMPAFSRHHINGNDRVAGKITKTSISLPTWTNWTESSWSDLSGRIERALNAIK
jgi:perosamine synthetase